MVCEYTVVPTLSPLLPYSSTIKLSLKYPYATTFRVFLHCCDSLLLQLYFTYYVARIINRFNFADFESKPN